MVNSVLFLNKLEALECLLSSVSIFGGSTDGSLTHDPTGDLPAELTKPSIYGNSSNWMSEETSFHIISYCKLYLALQYMSTLMKGHPSCLGNDRPSFKEAINLEVDRQDFEKLLKEFEDKLTETIAYFQQKFSLVPLHLITMVIIIYLNACILIIFRLSKLSCFPCTDCHIFVPKWSRLYWTLCITRLCSEDPVARKEQWA